MDIQELFEKVRENERKLRTKDGFEGVSFMDDCVTLNGDYDIELSRVKTKGELLGWIAQLAGKNWVTREHIYYFIRIASDENGIDPYSKDEGDAEINQKDKIIQNLKALVKSVEDELNELKLEIKKMKIHGLTVKEKKAMVRQSAMLSEMFDYLISSGINPDLVEAVCWKSGDGLLHELKTTPIEDIEKLFESLSWKFDK